MTIFARHPLFSAATAVVAAVALAAPLWSRLSAQTVRSDVASAQQSPGGTSHGRSVYEKHCVECHGDSGGGDGPASFLLTPRPRDFTSGRFKIRSTESGSLPTDADLIRSVSQGLYGTAMPGWSGILPDSDIAAVVDYVKSLSPRFATSSAEPVPVSAAVPASSDSIARGRIAYEKLQCGKCHGNDGRGTGAVATTFEDDWRQPLRAADLTEPWTFHGGAGPQDIYMRFRAGMSGTPMPSFKDAASDADMWDLANYVVSLARKPVWAMNADEVTAFYAAQEADARANPVKRGQYLIDTMGCAVCHTPADEHFRALPGMYLAGGLRVRLDPFGVYPTGNLTSDRDTGLGAWSDDEIVRAITKGTLRDGTRLPPYPMDYASFGTLRNEDVSAMVAYLRTVPPVRNKVPRPTRTLLPAYLAGKFRMLFLGGDPPITFFAGNAGATPTDRSGARPRDAR